MKKLHLLLLLLSLFACTKSNNGSTTSNQFYIDDNIADDNINIHIYPTLNDYYNNTNMVYSGVVAPYQKGISDRNYIPNLLNGKTYYIDWYSDDYYSTNWGKDTNRLRMNVNIDSFYVLSTVKDRYDSSRWVVLKDKALTKWQCVDKYHSDYYIIFYKNNTVDIGRDGEVNNYKLLCDVRQSEPLFFYFYAYTTDPLNPAYTMFYHFVNTPIGDYLNPKSDTMAGYVEFTSPRLPYVRVL